MDRLRVNVLGLEVSAVSMAQAVETIEAWIEEKARSYVCVTNVHGVMECRRDESLLRIYNSAGLVTPDGMPLVWLSALHGFPEVERVYGPDLLLAVCERSETKDYRHFFYGGTAEVLEQLSARLRGLFPRLAIVGAVAPPFRPMNAEEDAEIVAMINAAQPDIVWVGLGAPKQERWMNEHRGRLTAPVLIGVGAAFDFHSGVKKQAPRWMRRSGLEWLFRLASEPRRLWRRYLINNPVFLLLALAQGLGLKKYERGVS